MKSLIDCLLIPGYFNEKYLKVDANLCRIAYSPILSFYVTPCPVFSTFFNTFFFLTQLFNNFFFFTIFKIRLHSWYHLRRFWRTLEILGDGRHFEFLLQLCCLFWFWSFMPNMENTEIRIFEYSSKRMRQWKKKDETAALQNSFGRIL